MTSPLVPVKNCLHLKGAGARSSEVGDAAVSGSAMSEEGGYFVLSRPELMSMQLSELKGVCKQRGIPTSGSKGEIVERILAASAPKIFDMDLDSLILFEEADCS